MTRRPDETTEAYHARLATSAASDMQLALGEYPLAARPVFPVETQAEGLRERIARAACEAGHHAWPSTDGYNDRAEKRAWLAIADAVLAEVSNKEGR